MYIDSIFFFFVDFTLILLHHMLNPKSLIIKRPQEKKLKPKIKNFNPRKHQQIKNWLTYKEYKSKFLYPENACNKIFWTHERSMTA